MGRKRSFFFLVGFMIFAMTSACTTTRHVQVKDAKGNPATVDVKFGWNNKFKSATVQGKPVEERDGDLDIEGKKINSLGPAPYLEVDMTPAGQMVPKALRCSYCAWNGTKWLSYPPGCSPCP